MRDGVPEHLPRHLQAALGDVQRAACLNLFCHGDQLGRLNFSDGTVPEATRAKGEVPFESTGEILPQISQHYPAETARWLSDTLTAESTPLLMPALTSTAAHWASEDPRAAAAWAAALPSGGARAWAAVNVFDQWRQFDETSARTWWESLPAEERARTSKQTVPDSP